jgi:drug/metabolite transporter (DMT)-like permease
MDENQGEGKGKTTALLEAVLVTFLWATSWVLVKIGLENIPALTFAGLRYFIAFLILAAVFFRSGRSAALRTLSKRDWTSLIALGLVYYTITQGTQFLGLKYLPAILLSFILNFTSPVVALVGIPLLKEKLTRLQWAGMGIFLAGVVVYFYPVGIQEGMALGVAIGVSSMLANSAASILGRFINRAGHINPLTVTVVSMGVGATALLGSGLFVEEMPKLDMTGWGIILWLAVLNTAFAFTLWNKTLRTLSAAESSMINNTMLVQIAILAWFFLGERPSVQEWVGMGIVVVGVVLVNLRRESSK